MAKPRPERVITELLELVLKTGKDRASLFSEYIRYHYNATGRLQPDCNARDFYAALDEYLQSRKNKYQVS
jgi:hypothetical protein